MPKGLVRYQQCGSFRFITFGCYHRFPHLGTTAARVLFEHSLETMRIRYNFVVCGYVLMPDHVHLLLGEPENAILSKAIQALKLSVSVQSTERPFWQRRYYDFNVHTEDKRVEKLRYMHRNPVVRGLVKLPPLLHRSGRNRRDRVLLDRLASGTQRYSLPGPRIRTWGTRF